MDSDKVYDLIIIGGSAAATTAGIYAARRGLDFKIITKEFGGEVATSGEIGNWPGVPLTDGIQLADQFKKHLEYYKAQIEDGVEVEKIMKQEDGLFCITAKKDGTPRMAIDKLDGIPEKKLKCDYIAKTIIMTTGVHPRELNIPGEKEFRTKGVTYCTVCDGPLFANRITAVIGGGNSALEAALMLSDIASKVYVLNKNSKFKGDQILIDKLNTKKNVEIIYDALATDIYGDQFVKGLKYKGAKGEVVDLPVDGTFVHIGMIPNFQIAPDEAEKDTFGQIKVNENMETNIPGLYAAGDVTTVPFKQIVIAAGQGCIALLSAVNYLNKLK